MTCVPVEGMPPPEEKEGVARVWQNTLFDSFREKELQGHKQIAGLSPLDRCSSRGRECVSRKGQLLDSGVGTGWFD